MVTCMMVIVVLGYVGILFFAVCLSVAQVDPDLSSQVKQRFDGEQAVYNKDLQRIEHIK